MPPKCDVFGKVHHSGLTLGLIVTFIASKPEIEGCMCFSDFGLGHLKSNGCFDTWQTCGLRV